MKKPNNKNSDHSMAHVLYQKLGDQWYAFTEVDGDCFVGKVDHAAIPTEVLAQDVLGADPRKQLKAA